MNFVNATQCTWIRRTKFIYLLTFMLLTMAFSTRENRSILINYPSVSRWIRSFIHSPMWFIFSRFIFVIMVPPQSVIQLGLLFFVQIFDCKLIKIFKKKIYCIETMMIKGIAKYLKATKMLRAFFFSLDTLKISISSTKTIWFEFYCGND